MKLKPILFALLLGSGSLEALADLAIPQTPLFLASTEPRVMLVLSRDHLLSVKAYTDYSDLNDDRQLDTTYNDEVEYYGYFDSTKCYEYRDSDQRFQPIGRAAGTNRHECSGAWSGNFLNWATMTRLDVVRKVLYGGFRSQDDTGTAMGTTVLERAFLPPDAHAFAKVYKPPGGATEAAKFTPYGKHAITLCSVTDMGAGVRAGDVSTVSGNKTSPAPLVKVAKEAWPQWATTEVLQCQWDEQTDEASSTRPSSVYRLTGGSDLVARVAVCAPGLLEENCKAYYDRADPPLETVKPTGLLQRYGDIDVSKRVRFGLITGSYNKNTSGGVLRKNIGLLANNNRGADSTNSDICGDKEDRDEIDVCTGQFINQGKEDTGIIDSLNRIHIAGYTTPKPGEITAWQVCSDGYDSDGACDPGNLLNGTNGTCVDWGNPLSELYHEALRYFAGQDAATPAYAVDDRAAPAAIAGLDQDTWDGNSDPLPAGEWCALSNIIVLSTGLASLDSDPIVTDIAGLDPTALTDEVGMDEGIPRRFFLIGSNGMRSDNRCSAKMMLNLSNASGICPEVPNLKGGYLIAGLASANRELDLRPEYKTNRAARWSAINEDWVERQPVGNFMVSLGGDLPGFEIPVGGGTVTLVPACEADGKTCSMTNLRVDNNSTASGNTFGSLLVSWENHRAGGDYDMDVIARIAYCVGTACRTPEFGNTAVAANEIKVVVYAVHAASDTEVSLGYTISGTTWDGTTYPIRLPKTTACNPSDCTEHDNKNFFSLLTTPYSWRCDDDWGTCPDDMLLPDGGVPRFPWGVRNATGCPDGDYCGCPKATVYTQSAEPTGRLLKNPLWYAAKYGAPASSWDLNGDEEPDNFYDVRNPARLEASLSEVFDRASGVDAASASVATNSTNLQITSRIFQARFSSADWSGQLLSYRIDTDGKLALEEGWDAGDKINAQNWDSGRTIITSDGTDGIAFRYSELTDAQQADLDKGTVGVRDECGAERVQYLRGSDESCATTPFRKRLTSKLGDIVSSSPWYVGPPGAGFSDLDHAGYKAFVDAKASRTPVVYVGANDGMLHGFDASLDFSSKSEGVPTSTSGNEVIGFVPTAVYPNLSRLTGQNYNADHHYFVDGSPMVADADLDPSAANDWRTVLVGGLAGGGKGYYALDVSDPAGFDESGAANTVLWEFTEADDADVGHAFNLPPVHSVTKQAKQIVRVCTSGGTPCTGGAWAVILGNGYNSAEGKAALYVVFIEKGRDGVWSPGDFVKLVADAPLAPATSANNGLSTPIPFDSNGDGYADTVYAGDLQGNLWKFLIGPNPSAADVDVNPSTWRVAFSSVGCGTDSSGCTPLFRAMDGSGSPQPIVEPPEVMVHPIRGQMVLFGTGKYLEATDNASTQQQTLYGLWDEHDGSPPLGSREGSRDAELLKQTVIEKSESAGNYRVPTDHVINWRQSTGESADCESPCTPTHLGWYLDLPTSKERGTGIPRVVRKLIFFNTFIPQAGACDAGATGWLMALDWLNGGLPDFRVFDTNRSGTIDNDDILVGGYQAGGALGGTTLITSLTPGSLGVGVSSVTSGDLAATLINFGSSLPARLQWREIVQ